jgi:hypothetical protein
MGDRLTIHMNMLLEMPFEWTSEIIISEWKERAKAGQGLID